MTVSKRSRRTIILASASDHRRRLLKLTGISFRVKPSQAKEKTQITSSCASLVKNNAWLKAKDVAQKEKNAIVIGADSLVYLGKKKISGKPRTLKEAKQKLRLLSKSPQWLYTGLAVIDTASGRTLLDYEKTKVFMRSLSAREIDRYYRLISPYDKAGGFDIEGKGSLFIRRIEGCYFNVVGLPLAKLSEMLKKVGVAVLSVFLMVNIMGCASEYNLATQREETYLYSTEKEIGIGERMARQFDQQFKISTDVSLNTRVQNIGRRLAEVSDRRDVVYVFKVINDDNVNAVSLPGGFIYVFRGLIEKVDNDDQLAAVIAHEIAHIVARHSIKKLQAQYGYVFLKALSMQSKSRDLLTGIDAAFATAFSEYSKEDEYLADELGVKYLKEAGFDSHAMTQFLMRLRDIQAKEPSRQHSYWRTHPYISERISAANRAAPGQMEFRDYLNLMGE